MAYVLLVGSSDKLLSVAGCLLQEGHRVSLESRELRDELTHADAHSDSPSEAGDNAPFDVVLTLGQDGMSVDSAGAESSLHSVPAGRSQMRLHAVQSRVRKRLQSYPEGERIYLNEGWVARITQGVIGLSVAHPDGAEVVIGFLGPGDFIIPHPADSCHVMCMAHTHARVELSALSDELANPEFATAASARILRADAWAAAQAHPYIEQRLLGILQLISEQFGTPCEHGMLIDIRVTHSLLAAITGATRPTITRVLSALRKSGHIETVGKGSSLRICVAPPGDRPDSLMSS